MEQGSSDCSTLAALAVERGIVGQLPCVQMLDVPFYFSLVAASLTFALLTERPALLTRNAWTRVVGAFPLALAVSAAASLLLVGTLLPYLFRRFSIAPSGRQPWSLVAIPFLAAALPGVLLTSAPPRRSRVAPLVPYLSILTLPLWWYTGSWLAPHRGSLANAAIEPLLLGAVVSLFQVARLVFPGTTVHSTRLRVGASLAVPALVAVLIAVAFPTLPE